MSDDPSTDNSLPPKLDLSKRVPSLAPEKSGAARETPVLKAKPAASVKPPVNTTIGPKTPASGTIRITLDPSEDASAQPAAPSGTNRLKARPNGGDTGAGNQEPMKSAPGASRLGVKPKSVRLKPVAVGIKRNGVNSDAPTGSKRETSKIPLETAMSPGVPAPSKTIKIKPATPPGPKPTREETPEEASTSDPKRQTSRISLDAALGSEEQDAGKAPKTIRLKRPSEVATVRVKKAPEGADKDLQRTVAIEGPPVEEEDKASPTEKKTIKVKRPSQRKAVKSVSVKRSGTGAAAGVSPVVTPGAAPAATPAPKQVKDTAHWTFITFSIAAVIVCCVLIYVLCAQVLGPNISLTQLSYAAPDAELPWPGRILRY